MKKDNIKQNFRKPVGRDLEIVSEDMLKEKDVTGNIIGYDKLYNLIILQRKNGNLYVESGAGRNPIYDFEKNLIYQSVRREDSIVITDPEREICTEQMKDWIMRGPADREWLKIKKDNEKYKICRNSDITMYVGLRGFFDIDDGESDPWKDKTYEDFYIGGYFISRYEQDAGIYYKNSKGEKIEDAGCNQYMSKKNPYGIQKT